MERSAANQQEAPCFYPTVEDAFAEDLLICDKCGEHPFWSFPREGNLCPCDGKLVRNV